MQFNLPRYAGIAFATLLGTAAVFAATIAPLLDLNFESGTIDGWVKVRENVPVVTTERARAGKYSMKATLTTDGVYVHGDERNELRARNSDAPMNQSMWYGFSIFLPSDYVADKVWEVVAQWYPVQDDPAEMSRQPTLSLSTTGGKWGLSSMSSSDVISPFGHTSIRSKNWSFDQQINKWTDWVINVRWDYTSNGFIKAWKDGVLVLDYKGPTSYNDQNGPFFKMGIYKGWEKIAVDQVSRRTIFHDEFRMAGPNGSYQSVAPGGGTLSQVKTPKAPSGLSIQ